MAAPLDRQSLIDWLDQLGSADDAEVLGAARALHAHVSGAGAEWDELLAPAAREAAEGAPSNTGAASPAATASGGDVDTLTLIEELLAMPDRSEALREELEEYKTDIANGEFEARDHQYVRALYERLTG